MATVIGVRFRKAGKVYYFDPCEIWPRPGDHVVVETTRGIEFGECVTGCREVPDDQITAPLKMVLRIATQEDEQREADNIRNEKEAFGICQQKIIKHGLEMKLVSVEYTFDGSKIIFYFTANGRVDFRELVRDLASVFRMRIELRQIGVRDEAKMLGGLGACGRRLCCDAFLTDFQPVSIKMAKEQNLSLNPTKISGMCGRLMCCLKYEQDQYEETLKKLPRVGKDIMTPDGAGVVTQIDVLRERVRVRIHTSDDNFDLRDYQVDDVRRMGPEDKAAVREAPRSEARRRPEAEPQPEEPKRKPIPHQKVKPALSTEQFLEQMSPSSEGEDDPAGRSRRENRRRRKPRNDRRGPRTAGEEPHDSPITEN